MLLQQGQAQRAEAREGGETDALAHAKAQVARKVGTAAAKVYVCAGRLFTLESAHCSLDLCYDINVVRYAGT